jgi:PAS domain S-box-containing protein
MNIPTLRASLSTNQVNSTIASPFPEEQHHVNGMNSLAVIEYVKEQAPDVFPMLFEGLMPEMKGVQETEAFLSDPNNWLPSTLMMKLFANAKCLLKNENAAYHIGFNSILKQRFGHIQKIFIYSLGNPGHVIKKLQKINDHFNRTKTVEISNLTKTTALIRLHWDKAIPLNRDFCLFNKGIYQAIPTIWNCPPAELIETKDFFDGDDYCEYQLKWQPPSRLKSLLFKLTPGKVIRETIIELERDKELLKEKYHNINTLNRKLERKVMEMTTLQESSSAILSTLNLEDLLDVIVSKLVDVANLDRACIFLADKKQSSLVLIHAVGIDKKLTSRFKGYKIPLNKVDNIIARSAHSKDPIIVADVETLSLNPENQLIKILKPKSFILVPLNVRDEIIGIMVGDNSKNQNFVHETDKTFLKGFANHIAMALDNANLYEKLRESEERYREIVENVNEGIWVLDKDGNIQFANKRLVDLLGHVTLTGINISQLVKKEDKKLLLQSVEENLQGKLSKKEVRLENTEGVFKTVLLSSVPTKQGDSFSGSLAIITDLTDKKNLEKKLLQTQKLESIGTMAGGIAHDFNNILTGILGYTAILQAGLGNNPTLQEYTTIIEKSALRAADLVKKMLAFSRHNKPSTNASTSLETIIEDSLSLLKSSLPDTIQVNYQQANLLPPVKCDATELLQIILNLCLNARDAMPKGGTITISTELISRKKTKQLQSELGIATGEYVLLNIRDIGTGMTEEVKERIFDPFYTTKEVGKGSGLGLAMVYGIMQGIGGTIHVDSAHENGTVFKLFFPVAHRAKHKKK